MPRTTRPETRSTPVAFRAYADYMETDQFLTGVEDLLTLTKSDSSAVMCSESVWWRCHWRLLADHLVLVRGVDVMHLHDGRFTPITLPAACASPTTHSFTTSGSRDRCRVR